MIGQQNAAPGLNSLVICLNGRADRSWPKTRSVKIFRVHASSLENLQTSTHPGDRLGELLPDTWITVHPQAARKVVS